MRSFWVFTFTLNDGHLYCTASAYMETSMLNALLKMMTLPLEYFDKVEHSDIHWTVTDKMEHNGLRKTHEVFMADEMPGKAEGADYRGVCPIVCDHRDPVLYETSKREASGFKRVPSKFNFGG